MKFLIASDIHGSSVAAEAVVRAFTREKADELVLLGDIYNHGPRNPLPEGYAPLKVAEILNSLPRLTVIKGNCDSEVDTMISSFPFLESALVFADGKRVFLTHGHVFNEQNVPKNVDLLLYGHFHVGFIKEQNGVILANPGSAALPKENSQKGYLLLDDGILYLKNLDGEVLDKRMI